MEHHIKKERRLLHTQETLEKDEMTGTANRQEFCQALNDSEKNGLKKINMKSPSLPVQVIDSKFEYRNPCLRQGGKTISEIQKIVFW
jgi:hypothetical protein